jgi:NADPH-dependent ferric siderophore reductase
MPSLVDTLVKNIFRKAAVIHKNQITPHTYHIRIQGDALRSYEFIAGDHLRLFVGVDRDTSLNSKLRTYSVWDHNAAEGTADLAMCTHSSGIGAQWIHQAKVGEEIYYMGPKGKLNIDPTGDSHLLISDPSALSHMYAIRNHIPAGKKTVGITYAADAAEYYADLDGSKPFQFISLESDPTDRLIQEAEALKKTLTGHTVIYLGGDARVCKSLGRYFRQNWPNATANSKGFWMPGKTGMD